jgi:CubicO group peptidase (beta-lactamase class C family)
MNRTIRALTGLALLVLALTASIRAQEIEPERVGISSDRLKRINALVERYIEAGEITGAVTLVARDGRIVHLEAQGVMDLASDSPMQRDTIFRIASMSKPVAGVAILMLIEEGKVRLDDPVSKFIPSFVEAEVAMAVERPGRAFGAASSDGAPEFYTVPTTREVTVLDLLTHTSGVMSGRMSSSAAQPASARRHELGLAWVEHIGGAPLEFAPGSRWAYSALAGFDVLSRIVEVASGQSFDVFLRERIFEPLGMEDIFFWPNAVQRERIVTSYSLEDRGLVPRENPDSMSGQRYFSGAGGLMTSAQAYAQFAMMLANGGELNGVRILSPRMVELMGSAYIPDSLPGRPAGEGYGLSVRVVTDPVARGTMLSKGTFGWSGAYGTHFFVDPKENLTAMLMIQTPIREMRPEFEDAVMQSLVELR